ncbi:proton-conducting transporter membrane subunit [Pseudoroseomonas wenyumeiae]
MLVGYGIQAGLVPLHLWRTDAQAEAPTPLIVIPIALLGQAALHALLRAKAVVALNPAWMPPGAPLLLAGLAGMALAALALWRARMPGASWPPWRLARPGWRPLPSGWAGRR